MLLLHAMSAILAASICKHIVEAHSERRFEEVTIIGILYYCSLGCFQ